MKFIDIEKWDRKDHFIYFQRYRNPCLCMTFNVCVKELMLFRQDINENRPRLSDCLYYCIMKCINSIDEFKMRLVEHKPAIFKSVNALFSYVPQNRSLHYNCFAKYEPLFADFVRNIQNARLAAESNPTLWPQGSERQDLVYLSSTSKIAFSSISSPWDEPSKDSIPRVIFGKIDKLSFQMPLTIEVLHSFVDGVHIDRFHDYLVGILNKPKQEFEL